MSDTQYGNLEAVMLPETREMVLSILEERGVPLAYADAAARMSFDYSAMLAALGTTLQEMVEMGQGATFEEPQWYGSVPFAIAVAEYHRTGVHPADFHPYIPADQVAEVKAAGHRVPVIGDIVMTSRATFEEVLALSPEYALAALATRVEVSKLKLLEDWGFKDFGLCTGNGRLFYDDLLMHYENGYSAELVTECLRAFPRLLTLVALRLGITVEQVRAYLQDAARTPCRTALDVKRVMHPGLPDDYIAAMYGD